MNTITASIIGGSGYTGGELIRILHNHPMVKLGDITSRRYTCRKLSKVHPHLRHMDMTFSSIDNVEKCDVLFLCTPHGVSQENIDQYMEVSDVIIDLSSDFRLRTEQLYLEWYGEHSRVDLLSKFTYGVVELNRDKLRSSNLISSAGCNATAAILGLYPLVHQGLLDEETDVIIDAKVGSSEGGRSFSLASHHPERVSNVRSYSPVGHRHSAEIIQELGLKRTRFSATAIDLVRGAVVTIHILKHIPIKLLWKTFRKHYGDEPFIRVINERTGHFRLPDPRVLSGTNFCDIGFREDPRSERTVVIAALDNLVKGAAGQAVQAMNVRYGFSETEGLGFSGLFP